MGTPPGRPCPGPIKGAHSAPQTPAVWVKSPDFQPIGLGQNGRRVLKRNGNSFEILRMNVSSSLVSFVIHALYKN